jgi:hypothetical protein
MARAQALSTKSYALHSEHIQRTNPPSFWTTNHCNGSRTFFFTVVLSDHFPIILPVANRHVSSIFCNFTSRLVDSTGFFLSLVSFLDFTFYHHFTAFPLMRRAHKCFQPPPTPFTLNTFNERILHYFDNTSSNNGMSSGPSSTLISSIIFISISPICNRPFSAIFSTPQLLFPFFSFFFFLISRLPLLHGVVIIPSSSLACYPPSLPIPPATYCHRGSCPLSSRVHDFSSCDVFHYFTALFPIQPMRHRHKRNSITSYALHIEHIQRRYSHYF